MFTYTPTHTYITAIEPVWKVARYTSAAPVFFKEFENYVDGGVLANNPCDYGLTAIQNYYRQQGIDLPISLVVSVGTGIYPSEELGRIDAQEFLFFGKHWFNVTDTLRKRTFNLIQLLSNAVSYCVMSMCYFEGLLFIEGARISLLDTAPIHCTERCSKYCNNIVYIMLPSIF